MRLRSLESRIILVFLVLLLTVQLTAFFSIRSGINENARTAIHEDLAVGERVFRRLLEQYAQKLTQGARLLAADYGFKQAVGSNDKETVVSALANHGDRIGASLALLVEPDHSIKASTGEAGIALEGFILRLVNQAEREGHATDIGIMDNLPYQLVVVPVKAPVTIGWVAMAFPIDRELTADMKDMSSLQVSILTRGSDGNWMPSASTLTPRAARDLASMMRDMPLANGFMSQLDLPDSEHSARLIKLTEDDKQLGMVVLQRSISEAVAPYSKLQFILLLLTAIGTAGAVVGSIIMARRVTTPLRQLGETARKLGAGDYESVISIPRDDEIGELSRAFESMREGISKRELEIRRLAYWDTLTNLPNRAQFVNLLNEALARAEQAAETCQVLMMDLDRFKNVNDVLGHSFGDALLQQVAQRLESQLGGHSVKVARLGGDEFAILLPRASAADALSVARNILKSLEVPIALDEQNVDMGAGIGIAAFPDHGRDGEALLSRAEVAMCAAKASGSGAVMYDPALDRSSQQSLSMLSEMRRAVEENQFRLFLQPKVMLKTGEVVGAEALARWVHPERGNIFPDSFIPFAEKSGFIRTLTRWMLERTAVMASELRAQGYSLRLSVNISARDLMDQDLPAKFMEILGRHNIPASAFCLEITESSIMDDPVRALQTLEALHDTGVGLSIDDFGTGYSSLAYLKRLPVRELKIDKSFVMKMESDADDRKIVRSTVDLGHNMGLEVVAEGIENQAVWELLAGMGCDEGQGYFISRPMPADQLIGWLRSWTPPVFAGNIEGTIAETAS